MAQGNTETSYQALLKLWYTDHPVEDVSFQKNPLLAILPKVEDVKGLNFVQPIIFGQAQGSAAAQNFSTAQTMGTLSGTQSVAYTIPRVGWTGSVSMALDLYLSSMGDEGAFIEAMTQLADGMITNQSCDLDRELFGTGSGARAQVANTSFATSQLTLTVPDNSVFFEIGMQLDLAAAEFTGSTKAYGTGGHGLYVVGVDYILNIITVGTTPTATGTVCNLSDATNGIPTIATNDFIFRTGDRVAAGQATGICTVGLGGWLPYGGPASNDSFFGVNRSSSPQRLAGLSVDGTQYAMLEEAVVQTIAKVERLGGSITHIIVPFKQLANLQNSNAAKGISILGRNNLGVEVPTVGFSGLEFVSSSGPVKVIADRSCPANRIYGLDLKTWQYNSLKKHINIYNEDGNVWLRQSTDIGMELRGWRYGNLACSKPLSNFVMNINP